ncbi:hypothetical protein L3X38_008788 [Prunus dulcis]|uniref:RecA family profile 1 domain-containing protein n=1 Tax=Prunus dulcis TaxID=3755 RepID=A0AAD5F7G4_PRUDU|nr:hypothetical protein L3X38_008788 [Prunus dulcis]
MLLPLSTPKLSIGCPILDDCLGGGIPCNSITELTGESDYGRTQLCLQLTVRAQLPPSHDGLGGSSVYIFTKFSFSFRRLQQLGNLYLASYPVYILGLTFVFLCGLRNRTLSTFSKWCPLLARELLLVKERAVEIAKAIDDEDGLIGALNAHLSTHPTASPPHL